MTVEHLHGRACVGEGLAAQARVAERLGVRLATATHRSVGGELEAIEQFEENADYAKTRGATDRPRRARLSRLVHLRRRPASPHRPQPAKSWAWARTTTSPRAKTTSR